VLTGSRSGWEGHMTIVRSFKAGLSVNQEQVLKGRLKPWLCEAGVVAPKELYIHCAQIGLGRGAREGVYPRRYSTDGATKPQANFSATRRAACLLGGGVVARSLQIHCGICSSLAPSLRPKSIAANV